MILAGVPSYQVAELWLGVLPLINRALVEGDDRQGPLDVLMALQRGDMQLWTATSEDGAIAAVCLTELIVAPRQKRLSLTLCAGAGVLDMLPGSLPAIEAWARAHGASRAEIVGRDGWGRVLAGAGYEKRAVMLRKDL